VWAIAGRDAKKLATVKQKLSSHLDEKTAEEPDIILADACDQQSLQKMTSQTRVVITTVGPYALHGEPLIAACVKTSTDYVDITGETIWVAKMIAKYEEQAAKSGAIITNTAGQSADGTHAPIPLRTHHRHLPDADSLSVRCSVRLVLTVVDPSSFL
jgi:short subunit dehydrogenase-like uncharacterized protein